MKVSIWWVVIVGYACLCGGIFITSVCYHFRSRGAHSMNEEGSNHDL